MGATVFHRPSGESTSAADEERGQMAQSPDTRMLPSANSASVGRRVRQRRGGDGLPGQGGSVEHPVLSDAVVYECASIAQSEKTTAGTAVLVRNFLDRPCDRVIELCCGVPRPAADQNPACGKQDRVVLLEILSQRAARNARVRIEIADLCGDCGFRRGTTEHRDRLVLKKSSGATTTGTKKRRSRIPSPIFENIGTREQRHVIGAGT